MVSFEIFVKAMPPSLSELKVLPTLKSLIEEHARLDFSDFLPTLLAYLLRKLINEQGEIFCLLHEKLRAGWKENLKNLSEHALLLGTSE